MIKNVVFDLGMVLISFEPEKYLRDMGYEGEKAEILRDKIFRHHLWAEFDRGVYSIAQMRETIRAACPDLKADVDRIMRLDFYDRLELKKDTEEFLRSLKSQGYKIYFLSNFPPEGFEWIERKFDFFKLGDGEIISGRAGCNKPDPEIYELLLNTYGLQPTETVFIDDLPINIEAAEKFGIHGIIFTSADDAREKFQRVVEEQS